MSMTVRSVECEMMADPARRTMGRERIVKVVDSLVCLVDSFASLKWLGDLYMFPDEYH
jgi:hypothetical protein